MKVFTTSDLHFGHTNIIKYCNRPFADSSAMDTYLINKWNSTVGDDDVVYFLGDFAMGPTATESFIANILGMLHGQKKIVLGNHDLPNKKYKFWGLERVIAEYRIPRVEILDYPHRERIDGRKFAMCHYPDVDLDKDETLLHGHLHTQFSLEKRNSMIKDRIFDIGVDMYGGPVQITGDLRYLKNPKGWSV